MTGEPATFVVRYNDWREVDVPDPATFVPTCPVSVIIPYYEAPEELALALACLERQTYPRDLFEVIVVDDGSRAPPALPPSTPLDVRVVRQERRGFGAARARNRGVREARHDILVFLDGDILAEAGLLAAHARWHHAVSDVVTQGFCDHVEMEGLDAGTLRDHRGPLGELFRGRETRPFWFEPVMRETDDLTARNDHYFGVLSPGNFGLRRRFWELVGGMDESFIRYGGEDTEFAWRVEARGGLLVPVRDAAAWHQGLWSADEGRGLKNESKRFLRSKLAHLIPHPSYRGWQGGRSFTIPKCVVTLEESQWSPEWILDIVGRLLADPEHDLMVRVETRATGDDLEWLRNHLGAEPRVRLAPSGSALDEFPVSVFHIAIEGEMLFRRGLVQRLCKLLGKAVSAEYSASDGRRVSIARGWALHRARRTGREIGAFGDTVRLRAHWLALLPANALRWPLGTRPPRFRNVWAELRAIRDLRGAWAFVKWFAGALARRMKVRSRA